MPYTSPATVVTGTTIASAWGNSVKAATDFLANPPACRVYRSTNQSIPNNTLTFVTFDSERYDTDSMHSTVSNTSRITINTAGVYVVTTHIQFAADTDYVRLITDFVLNGATIIARHNQEFAANQPNGSSFPLTTQYKFAAADYVEVRVFQQNTSLAANNVEAATNYSPEFAATWIGTG